MIPQKLADLFSDKSAAWISSIYLDIFNSPYYLPICHKHSLHVHTVPSLHKWMSEFILRWKHKCKLQGQVVCRALSCAMWRVLRAPFMRWRCTNSHFCFRWKRNYEINISIQFLSESTRLILSDVLTSPPWQVYPMANLFIYIWIFSIAHHPLPHLSKTLSTPRSLHRY